MSGIKPGKFGYNIPGSSTFRQTRSLRRRLRLPSSSSIPQSPGYMTHAFNSNFVVSFHPDCDELVYAILQWSLVLAKSSSENQRSLWTQVLDRKIVRKKLPDVINCGCRCARNFLQSAKVRSLVASCLQTVVWPHGSSVQGADRCVLDSQDHTGSPEIRPLAVI